MDPLPSGLEFVKGQLTITAVVIALELTVARRYDGGCVAKHIGSLLVAPNAQHVAYGQGNSIGLICFVAAAPVFNGVSFNGNVVTKKARQWQANRDAADFPSSLHLLARQLGWWPMKLLWTLAEMSMGWMVGYLMTLSPQNLLRLNLPPCPAPRRRSTKARKHAAGTEA